MLVPLRSQSLLLFAGSRAHLNGRINHHVQDALESCITLGRLLVAEERGFVHYHDFAQNLNMVENRDGRVHRWVVEILP